MLQLLQSEKEERIVGIVILYKPDIHELVDNITSYIQEIDRLLLWQNSQLSEIERRYLFESIDQAKMEIVGNGTNFGIPKALNYAVAYAKKNGYKYLLSMDQDSKWFEFKKYIDIIIAEERDDVIYGPYAINVDDGVSISKAQKERLKSVSHVITSGSIMPVNIFDKIGLYKEEYFIDAVDEEICYRARSYGCKVFQVGEGVLIHHFGAHTSVNVFSRNITVLNYSAFRYYYIVRNHIWLLKSGLIPVNDANRIRHNYVIMPLIKVLLFEREKGSKIKSIIKGYVDGNIGVKG